MEEMKWSWGNPAKQLSDTDVLSNLVISMKFKDTRTPEEKKIHLWESGCEYTLILTHSSLKQSKSNEIYPHIHSKKRRIQAPQKVEKK